jgi:hypothetical protein
MWLWQASTSSIGFGKVPFTANASRNDPFHNWYMKNVKERK